MNSKGIAIVSFCIGFSIVCFIWAVLMGVMAKDLGEKVSIQEQEIIQLRWENENNYTYCEVE